MFHDSFHNHLMDSNSPLFACTERYVKHDLVHMFLEQNKELEHESRVSNSWGRSLDQSKPSASRVSCNNLIGFNTRIIDAQFDTRPRLNTCATSLDL